MPVTHATVCSCDPLPPSSCPHPWQMSIIMAQPLDLMSITTPASWSLRFVLCNRLVLALLGPLIRLKEHLFCSSCLFWKQRTFTVIVIAPLSYRLKIAASFVFFLKDAEDHFYFLCVLKLTSFTVVFHSPSSVLRLVFLLLSSCSKCRIAARRASTPLTTMLQTKGPWTVMLQTEGQHTVMLQTEGQHTVMLQSKRQHSVMLQTKGQHTVTL